MESTITIINPEISYRNIINLGARIEGEYGHALADQNSELKISPSELVESFGKAIGIKPEIRKSGTIPYANAWGIAWEIFSDYAHLRTGKARPVFAYDTKDYIYAKRPWGAFGKTGNTLVCSYLHVICDSIGMHAWYATKLK